MLQGKYTMQSYGILWKSFNPPEVNSVFLGVVALDVYV